MDSFSGLNIHLSQSLQGELVRKQVRFPKTRCKRVRKKWSRSPGNWKVFEKPVIVSINNIWYANHVAYQEIMRISHG